MSIDWIELSGFLSTPSARRATVRIGATSRPGSTFLSTPSARRATRRHGQGLRRGQYFYPRPPRGGRLDRLHKAINNMAFLSTPSVRRATEHVTSAPVRTAISIHALREEGDYRRSRCPQPLQYFYPRPPRGGRPTQAASTPRRASFLSTPSARRATLTLIL